MYNDTKTIYNKKLYVGVKNTGKKMYITLEIHQEADTRTAQTITHETVTAYKTLSMCGNGGQNREETADISSYKELFITEQDLQKIIEVWERWHLNESKAGCIHMDKPEKGKAWDSKEWERLSLQCPNGYKYGSAWLVEILPENVIAEVIAIFEKYNKPEHTEQQTNKATFKQFEIKASYKGTKKAEWSSDNFNNHMITVTNTETGEKARFEFWASIANPELNKEYDILNAFYCFVSDAVSGSESFENFCSEFGYDTDSRTAEKIYKKCQKQLEKLNKIYDGDIYELVNELSEIAG
jgi:hypothetical protein